MMQETGFDIPLLGLFEQLRQDPKFSLGIQDLLDLQAALASGFGLKGHEDLLRLCEMLWVKDRSQLLVLRRHFWAYFAEQDRILEELEDGNTALPNLDRSMGFPPIESEKEAIPKKRNSLSQNFQAQRLVEQKQQLLGRHDGRSGIQQKFLRPIEARNSSFKLQLSSWGGREAEQAWRKLRERQRKGLANEIDIDATVRQVARSGMLLGPKMRPSLQNASQVLVLVDRMGSMVPFHAFIDSLLQGAEAAGSFQTLQKGYFHDLPELLFEDPFLSQSLDLSGLDAQSNQPKLMIFSDAGAARGKMDASRISLTKEVLDRLFRSHERIVWLNPMPQSRWKGNSAEAIAAFVPMFECNPLGINLAVDKLRGRYASERRGA